MNQGLGVRGPVRVDTGGENRIQYYQKIKDMTANRGNKIPSNTKLQEIIKSYSLETLNEFEASEKLASIVKQKATKQ